jgi:hypothetical protein
VKTPTPRASRGEAPQNVRNGVMGNRSSFMKRNEMRLNGRGFRLPMGETAARNPIPPDTIPG